MSTGSTLKHSTSSMLLSSLVAPQYNLIIHGYQLDANIPALYGKLQYVRTLIPGYRIAFSYSHRRNDGIITFPFSGFYHNIRNDISRTNMYVFTSPNLDGIIIGSPEFNEDDTMVIMKYYVSSDAELDYMMDKMTREKPHLVGLDLDRALLISDDDWKNDNNTYLPEVPKNLLLFKETCEITGKYIFTPGRFRHKIMIDKKLPHFLRRIVSEQTLVVFVTAGSRGYGEANMREILKFCGLTEYSNMFHVISVRGIGQSYTQKTYSDIYPTEYMMKNNCIFTFMDDMPQVWATVPQYMKPEIDVTLNVGFGVEAYAPDGFDGSRIHNRMTKKHTYDLNRLLKVAEKFEERYKAHFRTDIKMVVILKLQKQVMRELLLFFQKNMMQIVLQELQATKNSYSYVPEAKRMKVTIPEQVKEIAVLNYLYSDETVVMAFYQGYADGFRQIPPMCFDRGYYQGFSLGYAKSMGFI